MLVGQVEAGMVESVRGVCAASLAAYAQRPRAAWVLEWPGQAVLVAAATHWTADVTAALLAPSAGRPAGLHLFHWLVRSARTMDRQVGAVRIWSASACR